MLGLSVGMLGMQIDVLGLTVSKLVLDVSMLGLEINTCSETGEYAQRLIHCSEVLHSVYFRKLL